MGRPGRLEPTPALTAVVVALSLAAGAAGAAGPGTQLKRARELLRGGQPVKAAALLAASRAADGAEACYWAGKALAAAGQRSSALDMMARVIMSKDASDHAALVRAAAGVLARDPVSAPLSPDLERGLERAALRSFSPRIRQGIRHRLAISRMRRGDHAGADALLAKVDTPAARYLRSVIAIRGGRAGAARAHLNSCRGRALRNGDRTLAELAELSLARLELDRGQLRAAEALYRRVPPRSPHFFRSRQELAWLYLRQGRAQKALAVDSVLGAPWLRARYRPDRDLVTALALNSLCRVGAARARILAAERALVSAQKKLVRFLRRRSNARLYYVEAMASAVRESQALSPGHVNALLSDSGFRRAFLMVRQLQRERRRLLRPGAAALRTELDRELDQRLIVAQRRAGLTVKGILSVLLTELKDLHLRAQELRFDLEGRASTSGTGRRTSGAARPHALTVSSGRQLQIWPVTSEFWTDEIGHFYVDVPSVCP